MLRHKRLTLSSPPSFSKPQKPKVLLDFPKNPLNWNLTSKIFHHKACDYLFYCNSFLYLLKDTRRKKSTTYIKGFTLVRWTQLLFLFFSPKRDYESKCSKINTTTSVQATMGEEKKSSKNHVQSNRRRSESLAQFTHFLSSRCCCFSIFLLSIEFNKYSPIALLRMTAKTNKLKTCAKAKKENFPSKTKWFLLLRHHFFAALVCL